MDRAKFERMIRRSIEEHGSDRRTMKGNRMRSSQHPVVRVDIELSPAQTLALIADPTLVPREVDGIPVQIAERPARVNIPHQRYMTATMCRWMDNGNLRGSTGFAILAESVDTSEPQV